MLFCESSIVEVIFVEIILVGKFSMRGITRAKQMRSHRGAERGNMYNAKALIKLAKIYIITHNLRLIMSVCIMLRTQHAVQ